MKINRHGVAVLGIAAAGTLLLAACGSDTNNSGGTGGGGGPSSSGSASSIQCASGTLNAAGSTAQTNAMAQWIKDYENACGSANINYSAVGSGAGVQQFEQGTIDFGGSDFALSSSDQPKADARCKSGSAINLPLVPGPIAIGYNVPGVSSLNLSASTLAKIFTGKITNWNDPGIAKDNPGVSLPNLGIQTFHRSDGSGTSYNFTNYLANEAKADWSFGANKTWPAPGGQGSKGTQGIAAGVKGTPGGIGYMELSYATQSHISYAKVSNAAGHFVELTSQNVVNFLATAKVVGSGNDLKLNFDYTNTDDSAYPNLLVTYEIVCAKGNSAGKLTLLKNFLSYAASSTAQQEASSLGYVPLPSELQSKITTAISSLG